MSFWDHFGCHFGRHVEVILGVMLGVILGVILGSLAVHFRYHFGFILGVILGHSGCQFGLFFYLLVRYQQPRGQYRDILVLFKINGYACELQINVDEILIIKEGLGHKQYELT